MTTTQECYSDHWHDIVTTGACSMCNSADPDVVGEILPQVERITFTDPVNVSRHVLFAHAMKIVVTPDGEIILDHFTASAVNAIYEALKTPDAKEKLRAMSLVKAVEVCWKLVDRAQNQA